MKILHLAASNRWTGAAAPAFTEVEALRAAGVDAHYAYVGGYRLQEKLAHHDFAHPLILKAQNPVAFFQSVDKLRRMTRHHGFDVVHAHLTYDHWLARFVARDHPAVVARTFHSSRALAPDIFKRSLLRHTAGSFVVNDSLLASSLIEGRGVIVTPPPLDERIFSREGSNVRSRYGIDAATPVITFIGKVSPGRGFEDALRTFAVIRKSLPAARLLIIGHGPHRPFLEELARQLRVEAGVIWAGYHEEELAAHYRAADVLLFTAPGSDEGHRAVIEAMGCGVTPAVFPVPGIAALLGPDLGPILMASRPEPEALAEVALRAIAKHPQLQSGILSRARTFSFEETARRLKMAYELLIRRAGL